MPKKTIRQVIQECVALAEERQSLVFHGTTAKRLPSILSKGLVPRSSQSSFHGRKAVFVARSPIQAANWMSRETDPVVIAINPHHPSLSHTMQGQYDANKDQFIKQSLLNHGYEYQGREIFSDVYQHPSGHRAEVQVAHYQAPTSSHWMPGKFNPDKQWLGRKNVSFNKLPDYLDNLHGAAKSVRPQPGRAKFYWDPEFDGISSQEFSHDLVHRSSFEVDGNIPKEAFVHVWHLNNPEHKAEFDRHVSDFNAREYRFKNA